MCGGKGGEGTIVQSSYKRPKLADTPHFMFISISRYFFPSAFKAGIGKPLISSPFSVSPSPLRQKWASGWRVFGYCPDYINTLFSSYSWILDIGYGDLEI